MNRLIIIGASGHGKVAADVARQQGYTDIVFLDGKRELTSCAGYPVLGPDSMAGELEGDLFAAVGSAEVRRRIMEKYRDRSFPVLVHPSAVIAESAETGPGTVVMAGAVINPDAKIGKGCIVNTCSSVDHDSVIGEYCHIAVGAHLAGTVSVGSGTWIGAGATVINNVRICGGCMIGAGAVVVRDIDVPGTYTGVPAGQRRKE